MLTLKEESFVSILPNLIYACEVKKSALSASNFNDVHDNVHDVSLPDDTTKIINAIKVNPKILLNELAKYIEKSKKTVQRVIKGSGQAIRIGGEKGGYLKIVKKTDG